MANRHLFPPLLHEISALREQGVLRLAAQALLVGAGAGAVIGLFRLWYVVTSREIVAFLQGRDLHSLPTGLLVFGGLLLMALISGWIVRKEPLLSGSGIPQVELTLRGHLPLPWLRLLIGKFIGTWICLTGGLSIGREGPSIQMGAAAGCGVGRLFHADPHAPRFIIGGSVAGMTAAFSAPLAGMLFAFEEMRVILSVPLVLFTACAALASWAMVHLVFGFGLVFPFTCLTPLSWEQHALLIPLGAGIGLLGAAYNGGLMGATLFWDRQRVLGPLTKPLIPFLCAGLLLYGYPQVLVGFGISTESLELGGVAFGALGVLLAVKILFSIISFSSGVSGGLLMPMLGIGGIAGAFAGTFALQHGLLDAHQLGTVLAVSMGALFGATVRAPLTGAALVLEMTGAWTSAPAMILTVFCATFTANRLYSAPIYESLKVRILKKKWRARHISPAR